MYKIKGDQISFRVNSDEKQSVNELLTELQADGNHVFTTAKEFMLHLISMISVKSTDETSEIEMLARLQEAENLLTASENNENIANEALKVAENKISELERALENSEPNEIQVEVIKEVEKQLSENQVIINFKPQQLFVLGEIAKKRFQTGRETEIDTVDVVTRKLLFNKATLFNWGGEFWTGISREDVKK